MNSIGRYFKKLNFFVCWLGEGFLSSARNLPNPMHVNSNFMQVGTKISNLRFYFS